MKLKLHISFVDSPHMGGGIQKQLLARYWQRNKDRRNVFAYFIKQYDEDNQRLLLVSAFLHGRVRADRDRRYVQ